MTKEQEPNYLKMAVDSMVDKDVDGPRVILGPTALKNLVNRARNAALEEAKQLFAQSHQEYFGREAQDAIESLKEPTP